MFGRIVLVFALAVLTWGLLAHSSSGAGPEQVYVVKPTDTLWSIAVAHYGGDPRDGIWRLERRNGIRGALLRPGQKLVLPP
jgi:nucleoid-associated protein YgaU